MHEEIKLCRNFNRENQRDDQGLKIAIIKIKTLGAVLNNRLDIDGESLMSREVHETKNPDRGSWDYHHEEYRGELRMHKG